MKYRLKIYLDTSVISALFDEKNPERKTLTELFFSEIKNYDVYVSSITIAEVNNTPDEELKQKMKKKLEPFSVLTISEEVEDLTKKILEMNAIQESYSEDAYHVAVAIINNVDFLLSWNFRHIVRKKTKDIIKMIITINNLRQVEIITPAELL